MAYLKGGVWMKIASEGLKSPLELWALQAPAELCDQSFRSLLSYVSVDKHECIMKFRRKEDAIRTLLADIMIRNIIIDKYKVTNHEVIYTYNAYGKPFLAFDPQFSYNISHSGTWVVAIVGYKHWVGIDVEEIRPIDIDIAKRFFTLAEYNDLLSKGETDRIECFYELWTAKESFIKALGLGLSVPLDSFTMWKNGDVDQYTTRQSHASNDFYLKHYDIDPAYKLSACATTDEFPDLIKFCSLSDLLRLFL